MNISKILSNINLCYVVLLILGFITIHLYLKNKISKQNKELILIFYLAITLLSFNYLNGIVIQIFKLKYLDVKAYLLLLVIVNMIILYTINKKIKLGYKILNYSLFILLMIIFGSTVAVILGNLIDTFYIMDISNAVNFVDLSLVIFIIYLIILCLIYIGYYLFSNKEINEFESYQESKLIGLINKIMEKLNSPKKDLNDNDLEYDFNNQVDELKVKKSKKLAFKSFFKGKKEITKKDLLSREELLNYHKEDGFYIDGVDCSIIFEDSNQENIIKNYHILSEDIHAKMVNGYTLEENRMLKGICMKLQACNLGSIDISNVSLLNKISVEEYDLLKKVFGS